MAKIFEFFTALLAKIVAFAEWLLLVFKRIFADVWNIATDLVIWVFDSGMGLAVGALSAIQIPFNPSTYYAMIPPEASNMLGALGITQAITIIVAALVIRFLLQLIPFVRLGS